MKAIEINNLSKMFTFSVKKENASFFKNLFSPDKKIVHAVENISFSVEEGETIAFIGPNGAGKSTTIKMLTGILFPTSGDISVLGLHPQKERKKLAYKIGTVFGQRSSLFVNLPLVDSLSFFGVMYDMTDGEIEKRIEELCVLFDLKEFKDTPVRKLSLGQRMRAEIAAALMHKPSLIFLDEPTIGLDVVAKKALREVLLRVNKEEKTTLFLTSHDTSDIESLCERTIVINHGVIVRDMKTSELKKSFIHEKYIDIYYEGIKKSGVAYPQGVIESKHEINKVTYTIDIALIDIGEALQHILPLYEVTDINVYDVDLETVIREMYEAHKA